MSSFLCDFSSVNFPGAYSSCMVFDPSSLSYVFDDACFVSLISCYPYVEVPAGGDAGFSWALAEQGFIEAFPLFLAIFAVYCVVKVLSFSLK